MSRSLALIRVSTDDQTTEPQRDAITRAAPAYGVDPAAIEWHEESGVSGCATSRPVLDAVMSAARSGHVGVLFVVALDRLGRSTPDLLLRLDELHQHGVRVVSLREALDFSTSAGRLVAGVIASIARFERDMIAERTRAGLRTARARGVRLGRPRIEFRPEELAELLARIAAGESLPAIHASGTFKVFDAKGQARVPSARAMRRALAAARTAPASPA